MTKNARKHPPVPPDSSLRPSHRRPHTSTRTVPVDSVSVVLLGRYQIASALRRRSIRADEVLDFLEMIEELSEQG